MPRTRRAGKTEARPAPVDWADPGYFSGTSSLSNALRLLGQLVHPPRGHRTLPTRTGSLLIVITIGVGTAAFNTGQNVLYLALALLLSSLLVSGLLSWWNFKGCRWRLEAGRHFRAGQASPVYLEVENTKRRLPSYALTFEVEAVRGGVQTDLPLRGRLDPGATVRLLWEFVPARRGAETILLRGLVSRYPFGFLKKIIRDSHQREIVVWPSRIPYSFIGDKAGRRWLCGHHWRRGEGVELVSLRRYRSGDPLKRIHWKATARMGRLQVRETNQEHHRAFSLSVDPQAGWAGPEQVDRLCAFAGSLAEDLYQRDQLKAVEIVGGESWPVGGIEDVYRFLDTLAVLEPASGGLAGRRSTLPDPIRFIPGPDGEILAQLEEQRVGHA